MSFSSFLTIKCGSNITNFYIFTEIQENLKFLKKISEKPFRPVLSISQKSLRPVVSMFCTKIRENLKIVKVANFEAIFRGEGVEIEKI